MTDFKIQARKLVRCKTCNGTGRIAFNATCRDCEEDIKLTITALQEARDEALRDAENEVRCHGFARLVGIPEIDKIAEAIKRMREEKPC